MAEYTRWLPLTAEEADAVRILLDTYLDGGQPRRRAQIKQVRERLEGAEEVGLDEAAREIGVTRQTVANWITAGQMHARRRGPTARSAYAIPRSEVERMCGPHRPS